MVKLTLDQHVNWFRNASPYINAHRGRTFVIHLDGDALRSASLRALITDITLLNSLGVRLVITYGARNQVREALDNSGLTWEEHQGRLRVDKQRLPTVLACVGSLRAELEARLSTGLKVISGNLITARPLGIRDGVDMHFCGEVRKVQVASIQNLLDQGMLVLLPPLGYSPTGEAFDLDAEEVATAVATDLKAEKLLLFGDAEGLKNTEGQLIRDLTPQDAEALLAGLNDQPLLKKHLQAACQASRNGVARTHLLSYKRNGALLHELFTRDGDGTLITQQRYETLRQAKIEDVGGLLALLRPLEESGVLVRRSRELLEAEIERFTVIDLDGSIIACAALYPYPEQHQAELACVVVHPDYRSSQRGDNLLKSIEKQAAAADINELFVLTTQTAHWFIERDFVPAKVEQLPTARQTLYNWQRNSQVFCKAL